MHPPSRITKLLGKEENVSILKHLMHMTLQTIERRSMIQKREGEIRCPVTTDNLCWKGEVHEALSSGGWPSRRSVGVNGGNDLLKPFQRLRLLRCQLMHQITVLLLLLFHQLLSAEVVFHDLRCTNTRKSGFTCSSLPSGHWWWPSSIEGNKSVPVPNDKRLRNFSCQTKHMGRRGCWRSPASN